MSATCTTCPYCGVGCGVLASPDGTIKGDPNHPANYGRLCSKGSALGETIDMTGRLLAPKVDGADTDWETALDLVAAKFSQAIAEHGPDSVAFYVSGQLLNEDYYVANKLMKGYFGSANIDTNSRLCMASSVAGHKRAFGTDTVPGTYEDLEQADLLVLVGSNLAWCHPVLYQRIAQAKSARPEMKVVVIDPRRTATCDLADLHLAIRPDGDAALFNALLAHLSKTGRINADFVRDHINGFDAALAAARQSQVDQCGLPSDQIAAFLDLWASTEKTVTVYSQGVNQSQFGTDKVNAILNCHLATGRIGRPGMGPFSVTGQPNAMGGREVGGLANMLAGHLDIENSDHRTAVQSAWNSPTICTAPGLKAVDLFQACADGRIKALWIMSTNPAVSMPNTDAVARAIAAVPFTVVSDIMERTDTGDLATVLLPASAWGEKSGTVTNSERRMSRQRRFLPVPDGTRPDWQIISQVAAKMGWGDGFDFASDADVFREYAALSALGSRFDRDFDISGLAAVSDAEYDALQPVQWPVRKQGAPGGRFFADGQFFHPDKRARMLPITPPDPVRVDGAFSLNTGRVRDHWHTMTRTGKSPRLGTHLGEPYIEIHPEDSLRLGLHDADLARVSNRFGAAILRVMISKNVQIGQVFAPMHWTGQTAGQGRINALVDPVVDPVSGQPAFKVNAVQIAPFTAAWYGFAVSVNPMEIHRPYFATARISGGWQAEIAGGKLPADWAREASELFGVDAADLSQISDTSAGFTRIAATRDNKIAGLLFVSAKPVEVARRHIAGLLNTQTPVLHALAGRAGAGQLDPGAMVCSCFGVGVNTLKAAIGDGANTVEALGEITCAGTNCGSCKPELAALLAPGALKVAAE